MNFIQKVLNTNFGKKMIQAKQEKGFISYNPSQCTYCGACERVCPVQAIAVGRQNKTWIIKHDICVRCGRCTRKCPHECLELVRNNKME